MTLSLQWLASKSLWCGGITWETAVKLVLLLKSYKTWTLHDQWNAHPFMYLVLLVRARSFYFSDPDLYDEMHLPLLWICAWALQWIIPLIRWDKVSFAHTCYQLFMFAHYLGVRWDCLRSSVILWNTACINQSNFYSANIPGKARLSGATAILVLNSKIDENSSITSTSHRECQCLSVNGQVKEMHEFIISENIL